MKSEGDPVQMNWIIQFYPKIGLDGALLGTSQTKKSKCIGSNMVNHAQDWSWVKIFFDLPNKQIPTLYLVRWPGDQYSMLVIILQYSRIKWVTPRDMLIWQIKEYLYPTSILGMIYHIRADAFIFFGLWCSHMRAIQPNFGVKLNNSIHLDWITFRLHKLSSFTILHWMTLTFRSIPLWKVVYWNPIIG